MHNSKLIQFDTFSITDQKMTNCDEYRLLKIQLVHSPNFDEEKEQD